jgi:hypothetical protein
MPLAVQSRVYRVHNWAGTFDSANVAGLTRHSCFESASSTRTRVLFALNEQGSAYYAISSRALDAAKDEHIVRYQYRLAVYGKE